MLYGRDNCEHDFNSYISSNQAPIDFDAQAVCAETLQVEMVRRVSTNEVITVSDWIPKQTDYEIHHARSKQRGKNAVRDFICFNCGYPVYLKKHIKGGHFFAHVKKSDAEKVNCIYQQESVLPQKELDRRRYQGQRESLAHKQSKEMIARILEADASFDKPEIEKVWKTFDEGWRKPDVATNRNGLRIVFEVQLSNTYPQVVAERTDFYKNQDALLIWVYGDSLEDEWSTMHSDNFCANERNLFVINQKCVDISVEKKEAHFLIYTQRHTVEPYQSYSKDTWSLKLKENVTHYEYVPFSKLRLNQEQQTATYFNEVDSKWIARHKYLCSIKDIDGLEKSIKQKIGFTRKVQHETKRGWASLICAIESARFEIPIATGFPTIVSVLNNLYDYYPQFFSHLIFALEKMGLADKYANAGKGSWKKRVDLFKANKYYKGESTGLIDFPPQHTQSFNLLKHVYPELADQ